MRDATNEYDTLLGWALASVIMAGKGGATGPDSLDKIRTDHRLCRQQSVLGSDALC